MFFGKNHPVGLFVWACVCTGKRNVCNTFSATNTFSNPFHLNVGGPTPRAASSMSAIGKHLFIFGGKDAEGRKNDLHIYNTGQSRVYNN